MSANISKPELIHKNILLFWLLLKTDYFYSWKASLNTFVLRLLAYNCGNETNWYLKRWTTSQVLCPQSVLTQRLF